MFREHYSSHSSHICILLHNALIAEYQNWSLHIQYYYWYVGIGTACSHIVDHDEEIEDCLLVEWGHPQMKLLP